AFEQHEPLGQRRRVAPADFPTELVEAPRAAKERADAVGHPLFLEHLDGIVGGTTERFSTHFDFTLSRTPALPELRSLHAPSCRPPGHWPAARGAAGCDRSVRNRVALNCGEELRFMEIYEIVGRNLDITEAMRNYAEEKLSRLTRFFDQVVDAKVTMSYRAGRPEPATVEVQVNVPNGIVRAEENGADTYAAVDLVVDQLER